MSLSDWFWDFRWLGYTIRGLLLPGDTMGHMAAFYAKQYSLLETCGSDNHWGSQVLVKLREKGYRPLIAGMSSDMEICSVEDFIRQVKNRQMKPFFQGES